MLLPCIEHAEVVVDFGIFRLKLKSMLEQRFRFDKISLATIDVTKVQQRDCIVRAFAQRFLEIADGVFSLALLRGDHAEVIPGFGIIRA